MPGYLTPDFPPDNQQFVRRIVLPASNKWTAVFDGLLLDLTRPWNWQKQGEMTPDEVADWWSQRYAEFTSNFSEAPEYDTPENVDGEPVQPWYEQLEDWIIAGFLAITFTPLAALTYTTTVPKIRVALRTGNIGALFKVLINGVEVWTGDSYAPLTDFIEQVFDNPSPEVGATVHVIHNGVGAHPGLTTAKLEYVRGDAVAAMVATILRADPTGCGIQWSQDNGGTWETIDLATCITGLANDAITQAINDGRIAQPGGQPGGQTPPPATTCRTYHVELPANSQWHLPFGLGYGDTIQVQNLSGTWTDGTPQWYCTDGATFELGGCFAGGKSHDSLDPLNPGSYHMSLIMKAGATWYDMPLAPFTQNSGTTPLEVIFQANDGTLNDNTGSISFDVTVCSGAAYMTLSLLSGTTGPTLVSAGVVYEFQANYNAGAYCYGGFEMGQPANIEIVSGGTGSAYWSEGGNIQSGDIYYGGNPHAFGFGPWPTGVLEPKCSRLDLNGTPIPYTFRVRFTNIGA